jgi:hypothetical protein
MIVAVWFLGDSIARVTMQSVVVVPLHCAYTAPRITAAQHRLWYWLALVAASRAFASMVCAAAAPSLLQQWHNTTVCHSSGMHGFVQA